MRSRFTRLLLLATVVLCAVALGSAAIAASSGAYNVTSAGSIDVPDRTVTLDGKEFDIRSVGHVTPGETIEATTQAPENESYVLYLYDNQVNREEFTRINGDGSASFPSDNLDPGTYVLALRAEREFQAIHPVVVAGYDVAVDTSGEVVPGETFTVEVTLSERPNAPAVDSVTVVRTAGDEAVEEAEATPVDGSDLTYEAELTAPSEEGEVRLLTTALGEESIAYTSEQEMLALTDSTLTESTFEVTIDEDASTTETAENETVEIVATVENGGDFTGEQTIELRREGGDALAEETVRLNGSERETVSFEYEMEGESPRETSFTVASADAEDTLDVTIAETAEDGSDSSDSEDGSGNEGTDGSENDSGGGTSSGSENDSTGNESDGSGNEDPNDGDEDGGDGSTPSDDEEDNATDNGTENGGSDGNGDDTGTSTGTDDDTITPNEDTDDASSAATPLTGFPHFVAALLVISLIARVRR